MDANGRQPTSTGLLSYVERVVVGVAGCEGRQGEEDGEGEEGAWGGGGGSGMTSPETMTNVHPGDNLRWALLCVCASKQVKWCTLR